MGAIVEYFELVLTIGIGLASFIGIKEAKP
jgi:hypothetical protein